MLKRLILYITIGLHTLSWGGVTSQETRAHSKISLIEFLGSSLDFLVNKTLDVEASQIYTPLSSRSLLQAITKYLPVRYQKGVSASATGCPYHIGDFAQGGVIIWLTQDGQHGLVAAIEDATDSQGSSWCSLGSPTSIGANDFTPLPSSTPNTPYAQYYSGYQNQLVVQNQPNWETDYPAFQKAAYYSITINGITYDDWFMPGSRELSLMWASEGVINTVSLAHGGLEMANVYWSSREFASNSNAWYLGFSSGAQGINVKDYTYAVRCLRAF